MFMSLHHLANAKPDSDDASTYSDVIRRYFGDGVMVVTTISEVIFPGYRKIVLGSASPFRSRS
jgi:hypothetical protein